jgi:hypothetical protein
MTMEEPPPPAVSAAALKKRRIRRAACASNQRELKIPVLEFNRGCFLLDLGQRLESYAGEGVGLFR